MFATLHHDLQLHLKGYSLTHPKLEWAYAYPAFYGRLNRCYDHILAVEAGTHCSNDWDLFHPELNLDERSDKYVQSTFAPNLDYDAFFSAENFRFFGQYWTAPDVIASTCSFCEMFTGHDLDLTAAMTARELKRWQALPEKLEVYRGHRDVLLEGCCWYPNRDVAAAWASIPYNGSLSTGQIAKRHIRALFDRRGEIELIVQHKRITGITTSEYETVASLE